MLLILTIFEANSNASHVNCEKETEMADKFALWTRYCFNHLHLENTSSRNPKEQSHTE